MVSSTELWPPVMKRDHVLNTGTQNLSMISIPVSLYDVLNTMFSQYDQLVISDMGPLHANNEIHVYVYLLWILNLKVLHSMAFGDLKWSFL